MARYAELHCHSYFSFLDGASSPEALVERAAALGMPALALTDHDGLYGAMRFYKAARQASIQPVIGAEVTLAEGLGFPAGSHLTLLARDAVGYANLSRLISYAHQRQPKGQAALQPALLAELSAGLVCLTGCRQGPLAPLLLSGAWDEARRLLGLLASWFDLGELAVELQRPLSRQESTLSRRLAQLADDLHLPLVATGNVHYATPDLARLQDVLVCIRHNVSLAEAGAFLRPNAEYYLRSAEEMAALFAERPDAVANAAAIAERCHVDLDFGGQGVPEFPLPDGESAESYLRSLCEQGLAWRYGDTEDPQASYQVSGSSFARGQSGRRGRTERGPRVTPRAQMEHELAIIAATGLSEYFLTVHDIVAWAKSRGIRCQGRGSAANSIVAYVLGITSVDPLEHNLLFERFLSVERYSADHAMPDIDIDFERDRREEVIQYVYQRYGWEHTAMVCTLVSFRARSAIRDVGKALGFAPEALDRVAKSVDFHSAGKVDAERLSAVLGEDADTERWQTLFELCRQIDDVPRHLGIHVGGMIITRCPLVEVVPVEPATMPGRVVVQWDKDSAEDAGLIKIDILSLAMLSAISEALSLISHAGSEVDIERLPLADPKVYDMICKGDTIGVFQVESRAQAQMLPRLRPRQFSDLVVEVALVRPGPIQGGMVHPYLRRRRGEEPVRYEHPLMARALADTLGIVVFQEQVLMVARDVAGFSAGEAELLRRAMSRKRSREEMERLRQRFVEGALANGASLEQANHVYDQLAAFSGYGFNRAHAASFALLTYASAWIKLYHPLEFYVALLNNQPMGFYSPAVVVEDAKRHGIRFLPVDVNRSAERCAIERLASGEEAIRLGLNYVSGMGEAACRAVVQARAGTEAGFASLEDFCQRVALGRELLEGLIMSGACDCWGIPRRQLLWRLGRALNEVERRRKLVLPAAEDGLPREGGHYGPPLLDDLPGVTLPELGRNEAMALEYAFTGVSSGDSPASLFRLALARAQAVASPNLAQAARGAWVRVGGQVIVRQHPPTAKGFAFITIHDEWGPMNLVLRPAIYERHRLAVRAPGLLAEGTVERDGGVINIVVERLWPLEPEVGEGRERG